MMDTIYKNEILRKVDRVCVLRKKLYEVQGLIENHMTSTIKESLLLLEEKTLIELGDIFEASHNYKDFFPSNPIDNPAGLTDPDILDDNVFIETFANTNLRKRWK